MEETVVDDVQHAEQIEKVPVPQIVDETVEVDHTIPHERERGTSR